MQMFKLLEKWELETAWLSDRLLKYGRLLYSVSCLPPKLGTYGREPLATMFSG